MKIKTSLTGSSKVIREWC